MLRLICLGLLPSLLCADLHLSDFNASFDGPPDVFIFGVQKGATTALAEILVGLKVCALSQPYLKEPQFFSYGFNDKTFQDYVTGYQREKNANPNILTLDASPNYFGEMDAFNNFKSLYSPESIAKKRFILVIREPVARLFSWYQHIYGDCSAFHSGKLPEFNATAIYYCIPPAPGQPYHDSFHEYLKRREMYTEFGYYLREYQRWMTLISRKQLLILNTQALLGNEQSDIVDRVLDFLGFEHLKTGSHKLTKQNGKKSHCKGKLLIQSFSSKKT